MLTLKVKWLYRVLGSWYFHGPQAQFCKYSKVVNKVCHIGLLCPSGTWFATYFYAMHRSLRLRLPLKDTVNSVEWEDLTKNTVQVRAAEDIENNSFWKQIYILLRSLFPALLLLRHADSNCPGMDKLYYLTHRTTITLYKSEDSLDDEDLFPSYVEEDNGENAYHCEDDDEDKEIKETHLGENKSSDDDLDCCNFLRQRS